MVALIKQETVEDYSLRTGLSPATIYRHIKQGKLKAEKVQYRGRGTPYWLIQTEIEINELHNIFGYNTRATEEGVSYDVWGPGDKGE